MTHDCDFCGAVAAWFFKTAGAGDKFRCETCYWESTELLKCFLLPIAERGAEEEIDWDRVNSLLLNA